MRRGGRVRTHAVHAFVVYGCWVQIRVIRDSKCKRFSNTWVHSLSYVRSRFRIRILISMYLPIILTSYSPKTRMNRRKRLGRVSRIFGPAPVHGLRRGGRKMSRSQRRRHGLPSGWALTAPLQRDDCMHTWRTKRNVQEAPLRIMSTSQDLAHRDDGEGACVRELRRVRAAAAQVRGCAHDARGGDGSARGQSQPHQDHEAGRSVRVRRQLAHNVVGGIIAAVS